MNMKINILFKKTTIFLIYLIGLVSFGQNLLNNGNFETGGIVGFNINGAGYTQIFAPFSGNTATGNFAITTNPQPMNTMFFIAGGDHTTGTGNMLIIDGNQTGGQQNFWEAGNGGSGICGLTVGVTYTFSYWIKSVATSVIADATNSTRADIRVQMLNANAQTLSSGNAIAPLPVDGWQQVAYTFVPTGSCVNIKLYNFNTNPVGNDFAVDDFSLTAAPLLVSLAYSTSNPTCPGVNNGVIVGYGNGGAQPYIGYNLTTGTSTQSSPTGIFPGLGPGTYGLQVLDANGLSASYLNIVLTAPTGLVTSANTTICSGGSTTLSASGSSNGYTWTASPPDASILLNPNSATPTVTPTQTTNYTVSSNTNTSVDLAYNGNFSNGNIGFDTDYQYLATTIPVGAQKTYGITSNANSWFNGFLNCTDHTGFGLMMVVDGSITNSGNDLVWAQTIVVNPGQNYTFSFWAQSLSGSNPASIRVVINGVTIGTLNAPGSTCTWVNYSQNWNSGTSGLANIQLYDTITTVGGNDFALDDITFETNVITPMFLLSH